MTYNPNQPRDKSGKWTKSKFAGGVLGVALLAGLGSAANGGDATTSVGAALDAATSQSTVDSDTASSRKAARDGDETEAWRRMALKEIKRYVKDELRCSVQSFGQVQRFFLRHPCKKLDQLLFAVSDGQGDIVVGSVMWVTMSSATVATQFKELEDTYGSGDVTPFGTEVLELGNFRFTGKHYKSRQDGSLVVIAEAEPVQGHPSNTLLQEVATVADVLPPL